jgi:hypothetical protein
VIITFLLNKRADVRDIADRLHAQFGEHAYQFRTIQFWITEIQLDCQDLHDDIRIGKSPPDDLGTKILAILDNLFSNQLA